MPKRRGTLFRRGSCSAHELVPRIEMNWDRSTAHQFRAIECEVDVGDSCGAHVVCDATDEPRTFRNLNSLQGAKPVCGDGGYWCPDYRGPRVESDKFCGDRKHGRCGRRIIWLYAAQGISRALPRFNHVSMSEEGQTGEQDNRNRKQDRGFHAEGSFTEIHYTNRVVRAINARERRYAV